MLRGELWQAQAGTGAVRTRVDCTALDVLTTPDHNVTWDNTFGHVALLSHFSPDHRKTNVRHLITSVSILHEA